MAKKKDDSVAPISVFGWPGGKMTELEENICKQSLIFDPTGHSIIMIARQVGMQDDRRWGRIPQVANIAIYRFHTSDTTVGKVRYKEYDKKDRYGFYVYDRKDPFPIFPWTAEDRISHGYNIPESMVPLTIQLFEGGTGTLMIPPIKVVEAALNTKEIWQGDPAIKGDRLLLGDHLTPEKSHLEFERLRVYIRTLGRHNAKESGQVQHSIDTTGIQGQPGRSDSQDQTPAPDGEEGPPLEASGEDGSPD